MDLKEFIKSKEKEAIDKAIDNIDTYELLQLITTASDRGKRYIIRRLADMAEKLQRINKIIND